MPFLTSTSLEVEYCLADSYLIARHRSGPPQGSKYPDPLQLALEALDTLPVAPVCLEGEPLDALARDDIATVLVLHPDPLPGWPEDAVLTLRNPWCETPLPHLAQVLLEPVAQCCDTFRRSRGDLSGIRMGLPQVRPELLVEEVDLVQHHDSGLLREPGGVELGPQRTFGPFRVFTRVEHERQESRPRHVPEKTVAEAPALAGPRDEARDVRHHEPIAVGSLVHDPELGREGGERILAHPRTGGAECPEQRRLPRIGQTDEADVREDLELEANLSLLAWQTLLPECRRLAGGGREGPVAASALAAAGDDEALSRFREVCQEAVIVEDLGPDGDLKHRVLAALASLVVG